MKIIDTIWFSSPQGTFGIVLGEDSVTGERKAYIGPCTGLSEPADAQMIAANGAKVPHKTGEILMKHFNPTAPNG